VNKTMANELENKGREMRTRLWGEQALKGADEFLRNFDQGFAKLLNDQLFGEIWNRSGLPTKTRSMITVAVLMALGRPAGTAATHARRAELRDHV
jgi:4-carboxymuconolactone decarboxylase